MIGHPVSYSGFARTLDFVAPELELSFDGRSLVPEAPGNPAGDPRELLVWFVNHCAAMGITIKPGWTVTTAHMWGPIASKGRGRFMRVSTASARSRFRFFNARRFLPLLFRFFSAFFRSLLFPCRWLTRKRRDMLSASGVRMPHSPRSCRLPSGPGRPSRG